MTSTHWTSGWKLSQEKADINLKAETAKPQVPRLSHPRNPLISRNWICTPTNVAGVVTHCMPKDSNVPARKFQCKICHKFGHFTTVCYKKSQQPSSSFKTRKPKAQQLQAGTLYTNHDAARSGSELSDNKESFCLQMKIHKTQVTNPQVPKTNIFNNQI